MFLSIAEEEEPFSYHQAMKSANAHNWKVAMDEEYESLIVNNSWQLCDLPKNRRIVDCRWIFKIKRMPDGSVDIFKTRLVARGFTQVYGEDYHETFSPVVKYDSIRILLSYAVNKGMNIQQFDIKIAFLYGNIDEEIYMKQPLGYIKEEGKVCKLIKSLYALKQARRCFNVKFNLSIGKIQNESKQCRFLCIH